MGVRATVCVISEAEEEACAFERWLDEWKDKMSFVSGDYGDGVAHLFDVEGPEEAVASIPEALRCGSKWVDRGEKSGNPAHDIVPEK